MIVSFIQARMGSQRLPGKVMLPIMGQPMLWRVLQRISRSRSIQKTVVVTSDQKPDDTIANYCAENNIPCFRGSEDNVLERYYKAAIHYRADSIVRITADCPLLDPGIADEVVSEFNKYELDYCATSPSYTYPDGFGVEVIAMPALKRCYEQVESPADREHVTSYIRKHPDEFKIRYCENGVYHQYSGAHFSVDEPNDLTLINKIYEQLAQRSSNFTFRDIMNVLEANPDWIDQNGKAIINAGYFHSIFNEKKIPALPVRPYSLKRSFDIFEKAKKRIPSCTQTFSKGYSQFVFGISPIFVERGKGAYVYDVDGNEYLDYPLALGAISLGHCCPEVDDAVIEAVRKGPSHSLPHHLEVELAEKLCEIIPSAEMVKFGKNGSDATTGAVRLARAITGREKIACCGYHGWHDWYLSTTSRNAGVPSFNKELTYKFSYGNIDSLRTLLEAHPGGFAAVIMEPIGTVLPPAEYMKAVRTLTSQHGALLIFDEIVTGFRISLGGAQEYFNVLPDISCFGKGMANGYPISAVVGKKEIIKEFEKTFYSFTFGGEAVSMAASLATIRRMEDTNTISHMWIMGRALMDCYNYLSKHHGLIEFTWSQGLPPRAVNVFKGVGTCDPLVYKSIFQQECMTRGIIFNAAPKICLAHTHAQIEKTMHVYEEAFKVLKKAYHSNDPTVFLKGKQVEPIFRQNDY